VTVQLENLNASGYHECRGSTNPSYKFRPEILLQDPSTLFNTVLMARVIVNLKELAYSAVAAC